MRCRLLYNVPKGPVSPKHEELKPQTVSSPHVKETVVFGSHFAGPGVEAQMSLMAGKVNVFFFLSAKFDRVRVRRSMYDWDTFSQNLKAPPTLLIQFHHIVRAPEDIRSSKA